ncbi:hypothetical protein ABZW18_17055 [Streptomyces sp. NPDC004647]|uniref:hypothetical protein n=1 Tax=Streptomyces sp. NPDC004647 TaxID=3154671 RepID=UPI0033BAC090
MSDAQQPAGPRPEPIRFFGTTWVNHDGNYGLRRAAVAAGSLLAAAAGALVLRFGYEGLGIARVGSLVSMLVVVMFAACSALAFRRTWEDFTRRPDGGKDAAQGSGRSDPGVERSMQSIRVIGFIGVLLAWFFRALAEAPGEKLHRAEYERECELHERRRATRAGNPAARAPGRKRKRR